MIKLFIILLLTISLVAPVKSSSTKVYVWRNEKGLLVFSDTPKPGAEEVKTKPSNVIKSSTSIETQVLDIKPKIIDDNYQVVIEHPENNSTIRDNTGSVFISGSIKPIFKRGLTIQLYVDDIPFQKPQSHTRFSLKNIDRGEHQLKMKLLDKKGKVIALSESITFYMHRTSVH